eukprot:4477542-Pyramimonas_sp.AAC.3
MYAVDNIWRGYYLGCGRMKGALTLVYLYVTVSSGVGTVTVQLVSNQTEYAASQVEGKYTGSNVF